MKLTKKSDILAITVLMTLTYFSSYVTRTNFAAIMVEFIKQEGVLKSAASFITTANFITYGTGQLLSGVLGDKFSPRYLIFSGLCVTVSCNLLMPLASPSIPLMTVIWSVNGLAQAFMWPPMVKILSSSLTDVDYSSVVAKICLGSAGGTLAVYLFSPVIIKLSGWKAVFVVSALVGVAMAVIWLIWTSKLLKGIDILGKQTRPSCQNNTQAEKSPYLKLMMMLLPVILITISLQGMLRDGISTWVPTFISETFDLGSELSILISVILPLFHVICTLFTYHVYKKLKEDVFKSILLFFSAVMLSLVFLRLFGSTNLVVAVILLASTNGFIHCVNSLQTCYLPMCYKNTGKMSTYSGILNFATYIGSALSTYLFAKIAESSSWNTTILCWVLIAVAAIIITTACYLPVKKYNKKSD